jgi:hypothetical protein
VEAGAEADTTWATTRRPTSGKSIGHTSVVFRFELEGGGRCVWKPTSRRGGTRWHGEVAAYALGRALGLPNVPPAYERACAAATVDKVLGGPTTPSGRLFADEAVVKGGEVHGALMPWIDKLSFLPLEAEPFVATWKGWLRQGTEIPTAPIKVADGIVVQDPRGLARQASILVAFDFLTANWDRWSGGNVGWLDARQLVLFIDNDGAFFETPPRGTLERNKRLLDGVDRFSWSFVDRVRALTDQDIDRLFGQGLLSDPVRTQLRSRRDALLAEVDTKRAHSGDAETLYFP